MFCNYCKQAKESSNFFRYQPRRCKDCRRAYYRNLPSTREYRKKMREKQKKYYAKWYKKNGRELSASNYLLIKRWKKEHQNEIKTHILLREAVRKGEIIKPKNCFVCKKRKFLNGHHPNYNKPLEVLWLCHSCHRTIHLQHKS